MTDYDKNEGAKRLLQLTKGLPAFYVGDTFVHPEHGKMTVSRIVGFEEGMTFGKNALKVRGLWRITAIRDGKKRPETVLFQVPDLIENPDLAKNAKAKPKKVAA